MAGEAFGPRDCHHALLCKLHSLQVLGDPFLLRPRISAPRFHVLAWEASGANRRFGTAAREFRVFSTRPRWRHYPHRNNPLILALWEEKKMKEKKKIPAHLATQKAVRPEHKPPVPVVTLVFERFASGLPAFSQSGTFEGPLHHRPNKGTWRTGKLRLKASQDVRIVCRALRICVV